LTFQAVELLVARETTRWRVYGGGDYIFAHSPTDLKPGVLHGGLEFRQPGSLLRLGRGAAGRFVAGLDVKSIQDRGWQVGWSVVTGLERGDPLADPGSGWRWASCSRPIPGRRRTGNSTGITFPRSVSASGSHCDPGPRHLHLVVGGNRVSNKAVRRRRSASAA